jgi:hypothetical protein
MAGAPEVHKLDKAGQVEMRLVAAGARQDMGQAEAAVVTLQSSELASHAVHPWTARLRYAYADALLAVGRETEARDWFAKALEADHNGTTDASDRLALLDGVQFVDAFDGSEDDESGETEEPGKAEPEAADAPVDVADDDLPSDDDLADTTADADDDEDEAHDTDDDQDDEDEDEDEDEDDNEDEAAEDAPAAAPTSFLVSPFREPAHDADRAERDDD